MSTSPVNFNNNYYQVSMEVERGLSSKAGEKRALEKNFSDSERDLKRYKVSFAAPHFEDENESPEKSTNSSSNQTIPVAKKSLFVTSSNKAMTPSLKGDRLFESQDDDMVRYTCREFTSIPQENLNKPFASRDKEDVDKIIEGLSQMSLKKSNKPSSTLPSTPEKSHTHKMIAQTPGGTFYSAVVSNYASPNGSKLNVPPSKLKSPMSYHKYDTYEGNLNKQARKVLNKGAQRPVTLMGKSSSFLLSRAVRSFRGPSNEEFLFPHFRIEMKPLKKGGSPQVVKAGVHHGRLFPKKGSSKTVTLTAKELSSSYAAYKKLPKKLSFEKHLEQVGFTQERSSSGSSSSSVSSSQSSSFKRYSSKNQTKINPLLTRAPKG